MNESSSYDAIVIGAGLGGLSAGCALAVAGKRVLVFEQHNKVGGYATQFTRGDFVFDVSLHNIGPLPSYEKFRKTLERLGIYDHLEYIPFDSFQRICFPQHDITIPKGVSLFADVLKRHFPDEARGIDTFFDVMRCLVTELDEIERMDVPIAELEERVPLLPIKFPNLVTLVDKPFDELLTEHLRDPRLKGIVANIWWICGLPPARLASILYMIPAYRYCETGGGTIRKTSQHLSDLLARQITSHGGEIMLRTTVNRILTDNGKVYGVSTENDRVFSAEVVIANANVPDTILEMTSEREIGSAYRKRVVESELSISSTHLFLGLDCKPEELGMNHHSICLFKSYDHEKCFEKIVAGEYGETFCAVTNYSAFNEEMAPEGKAVVNIFTLDHIANWQNLSTAAYQSKKKEVSRILIDWVETVIPGLGDHVQVMELGTPLTMQRYTRNPDGAIYGYAQCTSQSGINRLGAQTPVSGLYLAGAYTYPGAGFSSAIFSGQSAAQAALGAL